MDTLQPDTFYHIYNHANGNENLFLTVENYRYFLQKYGKHIGPIAGTYAYCLMPNHFHLLVKIKDERHLLNTFPKFNSLEKLMTANYISKQFSNLFSCYTQSFNKYHKRRGSLFIKNFKRREITLDEYFSTLVAYIHCNPVLHGFVQQPAQWRWSSYCSVLGHSPTPLLRDELINWYGNRKCFVDYHKNYLKDKCPLHFSSENSFPPQ